MIKLYATIGLSSGRMNVEHLKLQTAFDRKEAKANLPLRILASDPEGKY